MLKNSYLKRKKSSLEIHNIYPHNNQRFTEGLVYHNGLLYESSGKYGLSTIYKYVPETGEVLLDKRLPAMYFAEGIAIVNDYLYCLTWCEQVAFVLDMQTFDIVERYNYKGQGWGITADENYIYMSDSTSHIQIRDKNSFVHLDSLDITVNNKTIAPQLMNELECVGDSIYANIWGDSPFSTHLRSEYIVRINKHNGVVEETINCNELLQIAAKPGMPGSAVSNGIAYNRDNNSFFITGKYWNQLFEVTF